MTSTLSILTWAIVAFALGVILAGAAVYFLGVEPAQRRERAAKADVNLARAETRAAGDAVISARAAQATAEANLVSLKGARAEADSQFAEITQRVIREAQEALMALAQERLGTAIATNNAATTAKFAEIIKASETQLKNVSDALTAMHTTRTEDRAALSAHIAGLREQTTNLVAAVGENRLTTQRLTGMLSSSTARGSWGEVELTRLLEMTGMSRFASYDVQKAGYGEDGRGRPDVVIFIPGGGTLPLDAKAPFSAYQTAMMSDDETLRAEHMRDAVGALRSHIRTLAARKYHAAKGCIGWTVMFIPIESLLSAVLTAEPRLIEEALEANILIATPCVLLVYLHAFAQGHRVAQQQANSEVILEHASTLVARLAPFVAHFARIGERLSSAVDAYNQGVGSFDSQVAPQARRIHELGGAIELPQIPLRQGEVRKPDTDRLPGTATSLFEHSDVSRNGQ